MSAQCTYPLSKCLSWLHRSIWWWNVFAGAAQGKLAMSLIPMHMECNWSEIWGEFCFVRTIFFSLHPISVLQPFDQNIEINYRVYMIMEHKQSTIHFWLEFNFSARHIHISCAHTHFFAKLFVIWYKSCCFYSSSSFSSSLSFEVINTN